MKYLCVFALHFSQSVSQSVSRRLVCLLCFSFAAYSRLLLGASCRRLRPLLAGDDITQRCTHIRVTPLKACVLQPLRDDARALQQHICAVYRRMKEGWLIGEREQQNEMKQTKPTTRTEKKRTKDNNQKKNEQKYTLKKVIFGNNAPLPPNIHRTANAGVGIIAGRHSAAPNALANSAF